MLAVCNGHGDAAKTLIAKGADVTARSGNGTTPLHLAAERGHSDVADLLIVNGAATHAKRDDGWTPLMVAAQEGRVEVAGLLLKKGADVGATNLNGTTALYLAAYNGSQVLWTQKVNRSTSGVPTPPLTASDNPYVVVARLLISKGAQPLEIANSDPRALYVNAENHRLVAAYCQELGDWDRSLREYSLAAECFSRALKSCEKPPGESVAKGVAIVGLFVGQASDNAAKVLQQIEEQRAVRAALSGPCNELLNSCRTAAEAVRKMIAGRAAGEPGKTYSGDLPR
jgi:ankyrin repeat protein